MVKRGLTTVFVLSLMCLVHITVFAEIPAGYYSLAQNKKKEALKTALHELASPQKVLKYGGGAGYTWEGFYKADRNADGSVIDMYSNIVRYFNGYNSVTDMHIEHSLPKSWWGGYEWNVYKDLFHLYPSDGSTNMSKSNNPLGVVTGTPTKDNGVSKIGPASYPGYTGNVFEPADEYKGDFARSYFYVSTIYEDLAPYWDSPMMNKNTYPVWTPWAIQLLRQWHQQDPVSVKEQLRQEAVYNIQGNRNPYIDYPDLVNYIWGSDTTKVYPFDVETNAYLISPKSGDKIDYEVILQGDSLSKTITLQGKNITSNINVALKNNQPAFFFTPRLLQPYDVINGISIPVIFCPTASGTFIDTLVIQGGGMAQSMNIPLKGKATKDFMVLDAVDQTPVGATLKWIKYPHVLGYHLKVYEGALKAGNLMISSYVEGSGYNKAVELYNGTGKTLDLSNYTLQKQSNGDGEFKAVYRLNGSLSNAQTYLVALNDSRNALKTTAQAVTDSVMSFNGNDAIALYQNGILVDIVGYADAGSVLMWGLDKTLKRKSTVTHPSSSYNESEWDSYAIDYFSALGSHTIQFQNQETLVKELVLPDSQSYYTINGLKPEKIYHYKVDAQRSGVVAPSSNTMQFRTNALYAPEVSAASAINATHFTANWEEDPYTENFLLDVFQLVGNADTTITEAFNNVGSNGKPLPDGWSGTASGYYDTPQSSGVAPPSISLKNTGEWLQTKTCPHPVTSCSFMYKWASTGTGSHFIVQALQGGELVRIDSIPYANTSKVIKNYTFNTDNNVLAIRVIYANKGSGNLAFDDFSMTYGNQTTNYVLKDQPVTGNQLLVDNLTQATDYYYNVRSTLDNAVSPVSETAKVTTSLGTGTVTMIPQIKIKSMPQCIYLSGLSSGDIVKVFNITGQTLFYGKVDRELTEIPVSKPGVYIIAVQHQGVYFSTKILR
ncbi:MAG: endonuclease [Paludibacter sp.]|nr:endonuclease [Paludibacter sp.]